MKGRERRSSGPEPLQTSEQRPGASIPVSMRSHLWSRVVRGAGRQVRVRIPPEQLCLIRASSPRLQKPDLKSRHRESLPLLAACSWASRLPAAGATPLCPPACHAPLFHTHISFSREHFCTVGGRRGAASPMSLPGSFCSKKQQALLPMFRYRMCNDCDRFLWIRLHKHLSLLSTAGSLQDDWEQHSGIGFCLLIPP